MEIHDTEPHFSSVRRNTYVSQDLIQTMIHPSRCSRSESSRVKPRGRRARSVGGSGNGSNHGRIRAELSRRRVIIVSWHRSVVPFPAHRFSHSSSSLVTLSARVATKEACARIKRDAPFELLMLFTKASLMGVT